MPRVLRSKLFLSSIALGLTCVLTAAQTPVQPSASSPAPAASLGSSQPTASAGAPHPDLAASPTTTLTAPTPLPDPLGEARALYKKGDFDGAIRKYEQLLKDRPNSPDAYSGMARVYLKQKKVDQAAQTITQAMAQSDSPRLHVALGEILFRQGKIADAEKEWVSVVNGGHPDAHAYLGLARVRQSIAMYKSAKSMIDKAHQLDPSDPDVHKYWVGTLPRAERIKYYQDYLAGENNLDADERAGIKSYLEYLKERAKHPHSSCRLVSKVTATETPLVRLLLDPTHLRGYGLSVALNGAKSKLMLDTGASGITVNRGTAQRAGIAKVSETKIWGIGDKGKRDAYVGIASSIKIGDLEFRDCPVEVMESRSVAGEDGLVGADILENFLVELDFPGEKLKLRELPRRPGEAEPKLALNSPDDDAEDQEPAYENNAPKDGAANDKATRPSGPQDRYIAPEMKSFTQVYRFGHDLLIPTRIGDTPYKLFLMDTGALSNAISPAAAREVTKVRSSDTTVKGISGSVKNVYSANKALLQFGHLRQENQDMLAFDTTSLSDNRGTEISGFLGFVLLRFLDIKIDYRDALVDFSYDPNQFRHF